MKGFTVPNLIIHLFLMGFAFILAIPAGVLASTNYFLDTFGVDMPPIRMAVSTGLLFFFIFFGIFSLILGMVDFLVLAKKPKAYFFIELILSILGILGLVTSMIFYFTTWGIVGRITRVLIRRLLFWIIFTTVVALILDILNLVFTILFAVVPKKTITPVPLPADGTLGAPPEMKNIN